MKFIILEPKSSYNNINELVLPQQVWNFRASDFTTTRTHQLIDVFGPNANIPVQLLLNYLRWGDAPTEIVQEGTSEIWELINLTNEAHPIHIHLITFLVMNVQRFDVAGYTNGTCSLTVAYPIETSCFLGYPLEGIGMPAYLQGWKDTVTAMPGMITRLAIRFTDRDGRRFPFNPSTRPGYVWHCHLLGHEDNDMMRPLLVIL